MTLEEARVRHKKLVQVIQDHDCLYYQKDQPVISDAEYDSLRQELERLEAEYPFLITSESPTQKNRSRTFFGI